MSIFQFYTEMSNVPKFDKNLLYEFFTELDHEIHYVH
jgi:hypothetical protein